MKGWKRPVWVLVGLMLTSYLVIGAYFWGTQDQKIFAPLETIAQTPGDLNPPLAFQRIKIPVEEGQDEALVHGFWVPASASDRDLPTVLYLHGQDATIGKNLGHTESLHQLGCNVLVIDYRGFGQSFGTMYPSEASVYQDAEAGWNYLVKARRIDPRRVLIYGHSLGGAIAIELASRHPEAGGLIVESAFTSIRSMARWRNRVTYLLPLDLLLRHPFDSLKKVRDKTFPPVLFIHGTADTKVPSFMTEQLYDAAQGPDKDLLLIPDGLHASRGPLGQELYQKRVAAFIASHFPQVSSVSVSD